jgi:hypothetical protein
MRRLVAALSVTCGLTLGLPASGHPQHVEPTRAPDARAAAMPATLVGLWRARPDRVPLSEDSAWGPRATALRLAEMRLRSDGTGTITITRSVVNAAGRAFPGSRIIETAAFSIGSIEQPLGLRPRHTTTITRSERHYPDPPVVRVPIADLTINIYPPAAEAPDSVEIRFETFNGEGTFSDTLQRVRPPG